MAKYKLAALDMDGTLLNSAHELSENTLRILSELNSKGAVIAVSSGRALSELHIARSNMPFLRYIICENGACIFDCKTETNLTQTFIDRETAMAVYALAEEYDALLQVFLDGVSCLRMQRDGELARYGLEYFRKVFWAGSEFHPRLLEELRQAYIPAGKINIYFAREEDRADFLSRIKHLPLAAAMSLALGVELTHPDANKGNGLQTLCGMLGLPIEQSIGLGDGGNDVDMMRAAGLGLCMKNGTKEALAAADAVTDEDNDHDGAALALLKYMG